MKIKKIGHCCLVIETGGARLLTDPGVFSSAQEEETDIDAVLITHEHADHFHIESLKKILSNNPGIPVITNSPVGKILEESQIPFSQIDDGKSTDIKGVKISGHGRDHAEIYKEFGAVENTGFFIDEKLYYPGDAFHNPKLKVDILALPVAGPWMKMSEAIEYAKGIAPRVAFPVHDAFIKPSGAFYPMFENILKSIGVEFVGMIEGEEKEF